MVISKDTVYPSIDNPQGKTATWPRDSTGGGTAAGALAATALAHATASTLASSTSGLTDQRH